MKKYFFLFLLAALIVNVSTAQIPNFSFENWTNMGSYNNPDQWGTLNNKTSMAGIYTAEKGTPGKPGSFYLKLTSKTMPGGVANGIAVSGKLDSINKKPLSGFACNLRPQSLVGNWQHMIYGSGDQGSVNASLTKWNSVSGQRDTIATLKKTLVGMAMNWEGFSIPFTYLSGDAPDTCIIFLKANESTPSNPSYLWVDSLAFKGTVAGVQSHTTASGELLVFPNPSNNNIMIELEGNALAPTLIELMDLNGNIVISKNAGILNGPSKQSLNVSGLSKGTYLLNITSGKDKSVKKVVIQ